MTNHIMKVASSRNFIHLNSYPNTGEEARRLGELIQAHSQEPGAHKTPAAEEGNDVLSHVKGKYGELLFHIWLIHNGLEPDHIPFRDDYRQKVEQDDFMLGKAHIEIKTKRRGIDTTFPPPTHFNVNMGVRGLNDNLIYVFIEIDPKGEILDNPNAVILGWATSDLIRQHGQETWPGKISANGKFRFRRYDWDIAIRFLYHSETLMGELMRRM